MLKRKLSRKWRRRIVITVVIVGIIIGIYFSYIPIFQFIFNPFYLKSEKTSIKIDSNSINALAYSPDGKILATGSGDNTIRFWDTSNLKIINTINPHDEYIEYVDLSPNGRYVIAYVGFKRRIVLLSADDLKTIHDFGEESSGQEFLCFNENSQFFATKKYNKKSHILIWVVRTGKLKVKLEGPELASSLYNDYGNYGFVCNNQYFMYCEYKAGSGHDYIIRTWSLESGKQINEIHNVTNIRAIDFKKGLIVYPEAKMGSVLNFQSIFDSQARQMHRYNWMKKPISIQFTSDKKYIAVESYGEKIQFMRGKVDSVSLHVIDVNNYKIVNVINNLHPHGYVINDDRLIISENTEQINIAKVSENTEHIVKSIVDNSIIGIIKGPIRKYDYKMSPDREIIATKQYNLVKFWSTKDGRLMNSFESTYQFFDNRDLDFRNDGKTFIAKATSYRKHKVIEELFIISVPDFKIHNLQSTNDGIINLQFSMDGKKLMSLGRDNTIRIIDAENMVLLRTIRTTEAPFRDARITSDGKYIVSNYYHVSSEDVHRKNIGKTFTIWSAETGEKIKSFLAEPNYIESFELFPDNDQIACLHAYWIGLQSCGGSEIGGEIKIWSISSGQSVKSVAKDLHSARDITLSKNADTIASTGMHGDYFLMDLNSLRKRNLVGPLGHEQEVYFNFDSKIVATCEEDQVAFSKTKSGKWLNSINAGRSHDNPVEFECFAFSPVEDIFVTGKSDGTLDFWNLERNRSLFVDHLSDWILSVFFWLERKFPKRH